MRRSHTKPDFSLLALKSALLVCVFILGSAVAYTDTPPLNYIRQGYASALLLARDLIMSRPLLLQRRVYEGDGLITAKPDAYDGFTAVQGLFPQGPQVKLLDMSGQEIHRWPVDFNAIWPDPDHLPADRIPANRLHYHTQGMRLLPDGSIIVNIGEKGTAKMSKCGRVLWTVDRPTHHSITPALGGGYWVPAHRRIEDIRDELLLFGVTRERLRQQSDTANHGYENLLLLIDENGQVQRELSVLKALVDGGYERALFDAFQNRPTDPTHVNDVELVTPALAEKIAGVSAGDLLVSIRQMHMLAVLDPKTGEVRWSQLGPWVRQHDPDITRDGDIVVFNNAHRELSLNRVPGSNITVFRSDTGVCEILYPQAEQPGFFTDIMGGHQSLPNGNRLIVESRAGRVFEINEAGETVWDFLMPYDEDYASLIESAKRYDSSYFHVDEWDCPNVPSDAEEAERGVT